MARIEETALVGFRGGLASRASPLDFGEEQWAKLKGFVIEDAGRLRSQWPLQVLEGLDSVVSFGIYTGRSQIPFFVAVQADGSVVWRRVPDDDLEHGHTDLDVAWNDVLEEGATPGSVTVDPVVHPVGTTPLDSKHLAHASSGLHHVMMLNSINLDDLDDVWFVYEMDNPGTEAERLRAMTLGDTNKWPVDDETESSPKGEYAVLWNGVLVLGNIEWKADTDSALAIGNKTQYSNGLWLSVPGEPLLFDPLNVLFIGDPSSRITGLLSTEQGLLVFTNNDAGLGGVHILRGTPDAFTLEPLALGLGVTPGSTFWTNTNTYAWINSAGEIWQTDTDDFRRLDRQGLGTDKVNPEQDGLAAYGPWLLAARERQVFCLRALDDGQSAAWTELAMDAAPGLADFRWTAESGQSMYLLVGESIVRFTRADLQTGQSERGTVDGELVDLCVGSRTLSTGEGHHKTFWHRVGVRATAGRRGVDATLEKLVLRGGPVIDTFAPELERAGPWDLEQLGAGEAGTPGTQQATWEDGGTQDVSWDSTASVLWTESLLPPPTNSPKRWQAIVRGIGASNEFSIEALFRGDVVVEQLDVWFAGSIRGGDDHGR